jgi:hypothetical protein
MKILHEFTGGADGGEPNGTLAIDRAGNIYGVAPAGGSCNAGVVFELSPSSGGWQETVLYNFTGGADGSEPTSGLITDATGNLFGTTGFGGTGSAFCSSFSTNPEHGIIRYYTPSATMMAAIRARRD